ncbi:MAG: serine/threonine protein kinase [Proteobacteria bacterium]|nr:serine/threonine protein kinase [Pseudomonadota bacterium]
MAERFGKYELVRRIGAGGMAEVHVARAFGAEGFVKDVVIKRILPAFNADREFVGMFINEARLAARLHHANIVQVIEFDQVEGVFYIAMEWVDGTDLRHIRSVSRRRRLPIPEVLAVHVGVEALKGLHYAHGKIEHGRPLGLVHRDISPHNLLLSFAGELKIADFGIAKVAALASVTRTGAVKGKLTYMAPEQVRGEAIDQRTDLYALGIVLWELLSDRRLYGDSGSEGELIAAVRRGGAPPLASVSPTVAAGLAAVIDRLLAPRSEERFGSAAEVLPALSQFASTGDGLAVADYLRRLLPAEAERDQRGVTVPQGAVLTTDMPIAGPDAATHSATPGLETGPPRPAAPAARAGVLVPNAGSADASAALAAVDAPAAVGGAAAGGEASEARRRWRSSRGRVVLALGLALALGGVLIGSPWLIRTLGGGGRSQRGPAADPRSMPMPSTASLVIGLVPPDGELIADGVALGRRGRWTLTGQPGYRVGLIARWPQGTVARQVAFGRGGAEVQLVAPAGTAEVRPSADAGVTAAKIAKMPSPTIGAEPAHAERQPARSGQAAPSRALGLRPAAGTGRPAPAGGGGPRASRRAAPAPATLDVIVIPWAQVLLDGRSIGTTPITGLNPGAGRHLVELRNDDLGRHERVRLSLKAGEHRRLRREWTGAPSAVPTADR